MGAGPPRDLVAEFGEGRTRRYGTLRRHATADSWFTARDRDR